MYWKCRITRKREMKNKKSDNKTEGINETVGSKTTTRWCDIIGKLQKFCRIAKNE